jgi:hypothetical protein
MGGEQRFVYKHSLDLPARGAQAAMGRSSSDPTTQSFGCSITRVTNAFSVLARFENSVAVYTVGLTFRRTHGARGPLKGAEDFAVREAVADDHQVDITCRLVSRLGHRTVHEGRANRRGQGLQRIAQRLRETDRFNTILRSSEYRGEAAFA